MKLTNALTLTLAALVATPVAAGGAVKLETQENVDTIAPAVNPISLSELLSSILVPSSEETNDVGRRHKKKPDNHDRKLFEAVVTARIVSEMDPDDMSGQPLAFMEDALLFTYNNAHKDDDYEAISARLEAKGMDPDDTKDSSLRGRRRAARSFYNFYVGATCELCGDDMLGVEAQASFGRKLKLWQDKFCKELQESGYSDFETVQSCSLQMDRNPTTMTTTGGGVVA